MKLKVREDKFHIRAYFAPCACQCRFCCLGEYPKNKMISFDDYEKVLKKFSEIQQNYNMRLRSFIYNCVEHPFLERQIRLYDTLTMERQEYTQIDLNGTKPKTQIEIQEWFDKLICAGVEKVAFSWFGNENMHDTFVNHKGYFNYLKNCAIEARRRNLEVISKVFLHRDIISELEVLLDDIKEVSDVIVCAFMEYSGSAKNMQEQFLTMNDLEGLSEKVKRYIETSYVKKFKPEKEWIDLSLNGKFPEFNIVDYILYIDADNLQYILNSSVEDIMQDFRKMNEKFQDMIESIEKLALEYGDDKCSVLYECRDVLRKWLDLYFEDKDLDKNCLFSFTHNSVEWKVYERL